MGAIDNAGHPPDDDAAGVEHQDRGGSHDVEPSHEVEPIDDIQLDV